MRERQQAGGGTSAQSKKKNSVFFFLFIGEENISYDDETPIGLTATIMMQLSRNPKPTKGRALCSKTEGRTTNRNTLH